MLSFYDFVNDHPFFNKIEVDDLLFTTYDCPIEAAPLDYWTRKNYFTFMISGKVTWRTPVQEITVGADDIVFVRKGVHRVYRASNEDFCAILIFMSDDFIKATIHKHGVRMIDKFPRPVTNAVIPVSKDSALTVYLASLVQYFSQKPPPDKKLVKIKFEELILHLMTSGDNKELVSYFNFLCQSRKKSINEIMEAHFPFNLKLEEFARLSGRSLATFKRDFSKVYSETPGRWLKQRRLQYGKFLLESTDHNVNQITIECGFENASHFIRSFKQEYNRTPMKYRRFFKSKAVVQPH